MNKFIMERPTFRRGLRLINDGINYITPFYLIIAVAIILIPIVGIYLCMPDKITTPIASVFGAFMTIIVVPIIVNKIKRKYKKKDETYKKNEILYAEISKILIDILVSEKIEHMQKSVEPLNAFICSKYSQMCMSFSQELIWTLSSISKEFKCTKYEYKNVIQLVEKSLNIIRKSGEINDKIYIDSQIIEMIKNQSS